MCVLLWGKKNKTLGAILFSKQMSEKASFFAQKLRNIVIAGRASVCKVESMITSRQERVLSSESFSADSGERTKTTSQRSSRPNTADQLPTTVAAVRHHLGMWGWSAVSSSPHVGGRCQLVSLNPTGLNCPRLTSMK